MDKPDDAVLLIQDDWQSGKGANVAVANRANDWFAIHELALHHLARFCKCPCHDLFSILKTSQRKSPLTIRSRLPGRLLRCARAAGGFSARPPARIGFRPPYNLRHFGPLGRRGRASRLQPQIPGPRITDRKQQPLLYGQPRGTHRVRTPVLGLRDDWGALCPRTFPGANPFGPQLFCPNSRHCR